MEEERLAAATADCSVRAPEREERGEPFPTTVRT
jgi:hypothetical protein